MFGRWLKDRGSQVTQSELNFSVNVVIRDNKTTKKCLRSSKAHKAVIYDDTYA